MKRLTKLSITGVVVGLICSMAIASHAHPTGSAADDYLVWPLQAGRTWTYHCRDSEATEWIETREVLDSVEQDEKTYYTLRVTDNNPHDPREVNTLIRSTNYAFFEWSNDEENLIIVAGPVGVGILNETILRTLVSKDVITVPYGGPYEAYTYEIQRTTENEPYMTASFVEGLGFVRLVEYAKDYSPIVKELFSITPDHMCGDYGCPYPEGDINQDCKVDLVDFSIIAAHWLESSCCKTISEHVHEILIIEGIDYGHPDRPEEMTNEFILEIYADETMTSVDLLLPDGSHYSIPDIPVNCVGSICTEHYLEDGQHVWRYEESSSETIKNYDGLFTITVHYQNGGQDMTTAWFGIPNTPDSIPQVAQRPVVIYPPNNSIVSPPVSISWEPCDDPAATSIDVLLQNEGTGEDTEQSFPTNATSWPNLELTANPYEIELDFRHFYSVSDNGDGIKLEVGKYTQSDYEFTVE